MKFSKEQLLDWGLPWDPPPGGEIISNKVIDTLRRWSNDFELIFRLPEQPVDTAWLVYYSVGATEQQDEGPWEWEDEIEATLVIRKQKIVDVWEPE